MNHVIINNTTKLEISVSTKDNTPTVNFIFSGVMRDGASLTTNNQIMPVNIQLSDDDLACLLAAMYKPSFTYKIIRPTKLVKVTKEANKADIQLSANLVRHDNQSTYVFLGAFDKLYLISTLANVLSQRLSFPVSAILGQVTRHDFIEV